MATRHILIVDDEPYMTMMLQEGLEKLGSDYVIGTAQSGADALEKLTQTPCDLLITDYMMPGMNGLVLVRAARQVIPGLKVILMTAYGSVLPEGEVTSLGIEGYLDKPFPMSRIREMVRNVLA